MHNPLISIIVPVYNVEKHLSRCLNSIVNQTYSNLEIILVDDGSPDNCPQICDDWAKKDPRIKVIHKKNAGLGMARNTGIENASGDYICFFDSDDYVDVTTVEKALLLAKSSLVEIVTFGMSSVNVKGNVIASNPPKPLKACYSGEEVQNVFLPDLIDSRNANVRNKNLCLSACSCLFSMDLIKRVNWRFVSERKNISEDSYALIELYKYVKSVAVLPESLYYYCENETSLSHTFRLDRYEKIKNFYKDCCDLATRMEYNGEVFIRISGLFLSFSIAAMKQIAELDIKKKEKINMLASIISDETMQDVLKNCRCRYQKRTRNMMLWAMRSKNYKLCYVLISAQNKRNQKK